MFSGLLNKKVIEEYLTQETPWAWSHGANQEYLGFGLFYYAIVYALRAQVAVCLGSGGGFVPRLIRQAQRDIGIAETSRTILVDGNIPDMGWGSPAWMDPDSFFRRHFPDVEIVIDLTKNAAKNFFEKQAVRIDYLHIDADHSFAGCLEDFETYLPFLHQGSVITFHDTNLNGAGVGHVIEHIRTLSNCEIVNFPEIGEGSAIVRIGTPADGKRFKQSFAGLERSEDGISVTRRPDAKPIAPEGMGWKYLESRAFSMRYVLAAHFVKDCPTVIEIGGAKTPIDTFLTGSHKSVIVLDPFIRESHINTLDGRHCAVSHMRARFQDVDWLISPGTCYAMVMLGLEIQGMESQHYDVLYRLINQAKVTVIEFPTSWGPSREQFEMIKNNTQTRVVFHTKLDLEGNDFGNLENSWPPRCDREIYVLESQ